MRGRRLRRARRQWCRRRCTAGAQALAVPRRPTAAEGNGIADGVEGASCEGGERPAALPGGAAQPVVISTLIQPKASPAW
jgi:hypothetical protein